MAAPRDRGVSPGHTPSLTIQRRLLQQRHDAVVVVNTAEELQGAVQARARDIEIRSHLDLTPLQRVPSEVPTSAGDCDRDYAGDYADVPVDAAVVLGGPLLIKIEGARTHLMYVHAETQSIRVRSSVAS